MTHKNAGITYIICMKTKHLVLLVVFPILFIKTFAVDTPDGYASMNAKGLQSTTGGAGGERVIVTTFDDLKKYAGASKPYEILVKGLIKADPKGASISVTFNKTIAGLGSDATIYQGELHLITVSNIIIRNLTIRDSYVEGNYDCKDTDWDGIQADSCHHLWIDHCLLTHNCDGLLDLRKSCDYVTVSWVHFSNHNKAFGIGWTTNTDFRTTIHHCWFDSTNQRNPSFDMGIGHLYNNYVRKVMSYGNLARGEARVVIENSYFENCKDPVSITDNAKCFVSNIINVNSTGTKPVGNVTSKPFDPGSAYKYTLDPVDQVKSIVSKGAGPSETIGKQYLDAQTETTVNANEIRMLPEFSVRKGKSNNLIVNVQNGGKCRVIIINSTGQTIKSSAGFSPIEFSNVILRSGLYLIAIENEEGYRLSRYMSF
jgi:pectate lyase